jgi:hypothetical protein
VLVNGTAATNVVRISSTMVTATVPLGAAGLATFNVTPTTGTGAAINSTLFTYMAKRVTPLITSSSPVWVAAEGSTLVYVTGSNFRGSNGLVSTVTMGGVAVTDLIVSADGTSMSFRTPALSPGGYAVRVATNEGIVSSQRHGVGGPPGFGGDGGVVCDSVSPRNWTPAGGTSVTINGSGFAASAGVPRVSISGESATVTANSDTSITFLDPGGNLGTFDIDIVLANAVETTLSDCGSRLGYSVITAEDGRVALEKIRAEREKPWLHIGGCTLKIWLDHLLKHMTRLREFARSDQLRCLIKRTGKVILRRVTSRKPNGTCDSAEACNDQRNLPEIAKGTTRPHSF